MNCIHRTRVAFLFVAIALGVNVLQAAQLSTAFTYQGRLNDGAQPATGLYDLRFSVFETPTGNGIVTSLITNSATPITNGVFTVMLDFGTNIFDGSDRWLQVGVRTNGANAWLALSPRQPLSSTPYAQYSLNAGAASIAGAVPVGAITGAMLADGAVSASKLDAAILRAANLDDGGAAAYEQFVELAQPMGATNPLPISGLTRVSFGGGLGFRLGGADAGVVVGLSAREAISEPYAIIAEVRKSSGFDPQAVIGQEASVILTGNGTSTTFGGLVTGCAVSSDTGSAVYIFRIESPLAYLALSSDYRVRQNLTVPEVVSAMYSALGFGSPGQSLSGSYSKREVLIQFGETDLNYFSRLLEDEGIFYFFRQGDSPPSMVLGNHAGAYISTPVVTYRYYGNQPVVAPTNPEFIQTFQKGIRDVTRAVTIRDYNFKNPKQNLTGHYQDSTGRGETYRYGSSAVTSSDIAAQARGRLERLDIERKVFSGTANVPDLRPGNVFTLEDLSGSGFQSNYVVTAVQHAAFRRVTNGVVNVYYGNQFEVIPAGSPFRPALKTPAPLASPCTAKVMGPAGDTSAQPHVDEYGRVKVEFHWDRNSPGDANSSGWIRVASPSAGTSHAMVFLPRPGDEVLVDFILGDPDRPVIVGSMFNGLNPQPYNLPGQRNLSLIRSGSTNGATSEIRFDDTPGHESITISGRDINLLATHGIGIADEVPSFPTAAVNIAGTVQATTFQASGSALFGGNVGIGTTSPEDAQLDVEGNMHLNDYDLFLRSGFDRNHGLGWFGEGKLFNGVNIDGPVLYGCDGGGLGTACNESLALRWRNDGNVTIDPTGVNSGSLLPGITFGSLSGEGISSKRSPGGNQFGLDFYTYNSNRVSITQLGRVGVGTTNPIMALDVFDRTGSNNTGGNIHIGGLLANNDPKLVQFGDVQASGLAYVYVGERGQDDTLELRAARFYFNAGNVGIGITNPATPLEVSGVARATRFEGDGSTLANLSAVRFWQIVTNTTVTAVANRGYVANSTNLITFTLPSTSNLGDLVRVTGLGTGGWQVNGTAIGVVSGQSTNSLELLCVTRAGFISHRC